MSRLSEIYDYIDGFATGIVLISGSAFMENHFLSGCKTNRTRRTELRPALLALL